MKILTIDFDILMNQDLKFYNEATREGWYTLLQNPLMNNLKIDINLYGILTLYVTEQIKHMDSHQVFFIKDHENVNKIIDRLNIEDKIELFNLDFHHDLGYGPNPQREPLNCGNWVHKLILDDKLKSYTWLNAKDSALPNNNNFNCKYNVIDIKRDDFILRQLQDIDILIICLSPEWIPPYYQNLFYLWMDLVSNYYEKRFDFV